MKLSSSKTKRPKNRSGKKILLVVIIALLVIGGGFAAYALFIKGDEPKKDSSSLGGDTRSAKEAEQDATNKQEFLDNQKGQTQTDGQETPSDTPPPKPTPSSLSLEARNDDSSVVVVTKLQNITSGECSLTATNGSRKTTKTAEIIYAPEHSTCAGFSIPKSEIGTGTWTLTLSVRTASTTLSKTINFNAT